MTVTVGKDALINFATNVFQAAGVDETLAASWSDVLVWANLRGVDSHGIMRIPRYLDLIGTGAIKAKPKMTTEKDAGAIVVLEADRAPGAPAMIRGMNEAIARAKKMGIGWCAVRNISHAGAIGYFAEMAANVGLAGIVMSASGRPLMAYHGASAAGVSTNPVAIAVPAHGRRPLLLDMSTSNVSFGKLLNARKLGHSIPTGWAMDGKGRDTTDPHEAESLIPLGGPKGSGLSFMIEALCSLAVGNPLLDPWMRGQSDHSMPVLNGMALAVDLSALGDPEQFRGDIDKLTESISGLPKAEGVERIFMPGERGNSVLEQRQREGIPVPKAIWNKLVAAADALRVSPAAEET